MAEMNFMDGLARLHREQAKVIAATMPKSSNVTAENAWKRVINTSPGELADQAKLHDPRMIGAGVSAHANWLRAIKAQV